MAEHTLLVLLLENGVLLSLGRYKNDKERLKIAFGILNQNKWYEELNLPLEQFKIWIAKMIIKYQKLDEQSLYKHFRHNSELIKRNIACHYYNDYTKFLESLTAIGDSIDDNFISYHYEIFPFLKVKNQTPMLQLSYEIFFEYIEALILYAASDNSDFNLHQNESMLIMNEIKSYITYRPVENTSPSDMFFAILEVAKAKSKNHISTRFEGIVKSNLKYMNDVQDSYFLNMFKQLQQSDGKHSTQEKLFDSIIEIGKAKVAPYEAKERIAQESVNKLLGIKNPFASYNDFRPEWLALIPQPSKDAVKFLWKSLASMMLSHYSQYHIMEINKKNLYYLFTLKELSLENLEYLTTLRDVVSLTNVIHWNQDVEYEVTLRLSTVYRYFEVKK